MQILLIIIGVVVVIALLFPRFMVYLEKKKGYDLDKPLHKDLQDRSSI